MGKPQEGQREGRHPMRLVGEHIWFSLTGPKVEVGTKIRQAVSYLSDPGHLGLIVSEVIVWLLDCC